MVRCHNIARAAAARVSHASNAPARKSAARRASMEVAGTPSPPLGAERAGVRWGIPERLPVPTSPSQRSALGPSLSPLKGGEGKNLRAARRVEGGAPASQCGAQAVRQLAPHRRPEKVADDEAPAVRGNKQPVRFIAAFFEDDAQPEWLKSPHQPLAVDADPFDREVVAGKAQ